MTVNDLRKALAVMPADAIVDVRYKDTLMSGSDPATCTDKLEGIEYLDCGPNGQWVTLVAEGTHR